MPDRLRSDLEEILKDDVGRLRAPTLVMGSTGGG